jgi:hypothetical protein
VKNRSILMREMIAPGYLLKIIFIIGMDFHKGQKKSFCERKLPMTYKERQ